MPSIYDLSTSEASNSTTAGWNTAENQDPSTVNDGMRVAKEILAAFVDDLGGVNTVSGTANALTVALATIAGSNSISAYATGHMLTFKSLSANTTSVTVNVNSIGAKHLRKISGGSDVALVAGDIQPGVMYRSTYDTSANAAAGAYVVHNPSTEGRFPPGHINGLTLSNNGSDATNDIDIAAGKCRDSTDSDNMVLASALTKRLDASWAVGTGNGGLDTGSIADTTYHIWLIKRSDTGVVDALFSTSASSPTMPTSYDYKRRIGSIVRASSAIVAFTQVGDTFIWAAPVTDRTSTSAAATALKTLTLPSGVVVAPLVRVQQNMNTGGNAYTEIATAGANIGSGQHIVTQTVLAGELTAGSPPPNFFTNTSAQVQFAVTIASGTLAANILQTYGWVDRRGRDT